MGYMNSQICKCCGRPLGEPEKNISAHPNVCVECSTAGEVIEAASAAESPRAILPMGPRQEDADPVAFAM
jgi:hypothetical protein